MSADIYTIERRKTGNRHKPDARRRQGQKRGFFVAFNFTPGAEEEIRRASTEEGLDIVAITVREILQEQTAHPD